MILQPAVLSARMYRVHSQHKSLSETIWQTTEIFHHLASVWVDMTSVTAWSTKRPSTESTFTQGTDSHKEHELCSSIIKMNLLIYISIYIWAYNTWRTYKCMMFFEVERYFHYWVIQSTWMNDLDEFYLMNNIFRLILELFSFCVEIIAEKHIPMG